ncbi:MAG TPA: ATP-binding protein [Solirubrobacterales bacterium]
MTIAVAYLLLLALVAFGVPLGVSLGKRVDSEVRAQAKSQAEVVAASAPELLEHSQRAVLQRLVVRSAEAQRGRVIVVDGKGTVIADSGTPAELGVDYASRPEIETALAGGTSQEVRHSATLGEDLLATAVPILRAGRPVGAVRVTQSNAAVSDATHSALVRLIGLGAIVLLLGALAGGLIARETSRPIGRLEEAAQQVEAGDLSARAPVEGSSEQRALARSFNSMTARLGRLLGSQREFVADASHQLRTPLTGIRLQLEELREEVSNDDPRAAELDTALKEVDRLTSIVNELLILSRAGEREMPAELIDVGAEVDQAVSRWRKAAAESRIKLTHASNGTAPSCVCARSDFDRVLDSLIENAVIYSPPDSEVRVVTEADRVEVLDHGPGLAPGEEEVVFERFHRGRAGRSGRPGTGLGLSIARELATAWGGQVTIANREGGGARAVISLPSHHQVGNGEGRHA